MLSAGIHWLQQMVLCVESLLLGMSVSAGLMLSDSNPDEVLSYFTPHKSVDAL